MGKGLGKVQRNLLHEISLLEGKDDSFPGVHRYVLGKVIRRLGGESVAHARDRLICSGYLERIWNGWKPDPKEQPRLTGEELIEARAGGRIVSGFDHPGPPAYYYRLTDKGKSWVEANKAMV